MENFSQNFQKNFRAERKKDRRSEPRPRQPFCLCEKNVRMNVNASESLLSSNMAPYAARRAFAYGCKAILRRPSRACQGNDGEPLT